MDVINNVSVAGSRVCSPPVSVVVVFQARLYDASVVSQIVRSVVIGNDERNKPHSRLVKLDLWGTNYFILLLIYL